MHEIPRVLKSSFDDEIQKYLSKGYVVSSQTSTSVQLIKYKKINWLVFLILTLIMVLPGVIYLLDNAINKIEDTVYLYISFNEDSQDQIKTTSDRGKESLPTWAIILIALIIIIGLLTQR